MRWWACVVVLLVTTGCAHNKTRAPRGAATVPQSSASDQRETASQSTGIRDNIHAPQSRRYRQKNDGSPDVAADISRIAALVEPVPKVEPRSRYGNRSPYTVNGHTYRVLSTAHGYHQRGISSWYGTKFHGHLTSSFEPYDMYKFSAAHKTLPLPSYVRVTNLDNGKSVIVRVNDRGPFHDNRLIDLSYAAAVRLDIWRQGTGVVDVQAIDPATGGELPAPAVVSTMGHTPQIYLQVGAYADAGNAGRMLERMRVMGIRGASVTTTEVGGRTFHRVRVGPLADVAAVDMLNRKLERQGISSTQVEVN